MFIYVHLIILQYPQTFSFFFATVTLHTCHWCWHLSYHSWTAFILITAAKQHGFGWTVVTFKHFYVLHAHMYFYCSANTITWGTGLIVYYTVDLNCISARMVYNNLSVFFVLTASYHFITCCSGPTIPLLASGCVWRVHTVCIFFLCVQKYTRYF